MGKIVNYFAGGLKSFFGNYQKQDTNTTIDKILNEDEITSISNEILLMTFNQLTELMNSSKGLPRPQGITVQTPNAQQPAGNDLKSNLTNFLSSASPQDLEKFVDQVKSGLDLQQWLATNFNK